MPLHGGIQLQSLSFEKSSTVRVKEPWNSDETCDFSAFGVMRKLFVEHSGCIPQVPRPMKQKERDGLNKCPIAASPSRTGITVSLVLRPPMFSMIHVEA